MISTDELLALLYDEIEHWNTEEYLDPNFINNHDYYSGAKAAILHLINLCNTQ